MGKVLLFLSWALCKLGKKCVFSQKVDCWSTLLQSKSGYFSLIMWKWTLKHFVTPGLCVLVLQKVARCKSRRQKWHTCKINKNSNNNNNINKNRTQNTKSNKQSSGCDSWLLMSRLQRMLQQCQFIHNMVAASREEMKEKRTARNVSFPQGTKKMWPFYSRMLFFGESLVKRCSASRPAVGEVMCVECLCSHQYDAPSCTYLAKWQWKCVTIVWVA